MLRLTFCKTCFTEPIIWKALKISHSEPCTLKLNLWVKPNKYFIAWKAAMKVEFVIDKSRHLNNTCVAVPTTCWCNALKTLYEWLIHLLKVFKYNIFFHPGWKKNSQNILNFFLVIFFILRGCCIMSLNTIFKSATSFWWIFQKYSKLFQRIKNSTSCISSKHVCHSIHCLRSAIFDDIERRLFKNTENVIA